MKISRVAYICLILGLLSVQGLAQVHHFSVEASGGGIIAGQTAGVPVFIQITALDSVNAIVTSFGETVDITSTGTLVAGGGTTAAFTNGVLNPYSVTFSNVGTFSITATRTVGTETGTSNLFAVDPGAATEVRVETLPNGTGGIVPPQNVVAGNQLQVYAVTRDTFYNFIANVAADSWALQSVTGGVLSGDLVPSLDRKSAVFTGDKIGTAVIGAASGVLPATTSGTLTVTPGQLDNFLVESSSGGSIPAQTIGVPFTIRVTARDTFGNTASGFGGTVGITSTGFLLAGGGTTASFTNGVLSSHSVTFGNTGTFSITATRTSGTEFGTSNLFAVSSGAAAKVRVETSPDGSGVIVPAQNVAAGSQVVVYAVTRDAFNNFIANVAADSWTLQSITGGVLAGDLVPAADLKSAVFTGHRTGTAVIHATSGSLPATSSGTITVTPGPLDNFLVESSAGGNIPTQAAGVPFTIRVTARDTFGNTASGFVGTVGITSTGTLSAGGGTTAAFTNGVLSSQSVEFSNTGTFTITATRTAGTETGTSNLFTVTSGPAKSVRVETLPNGSGSLVPSQNVVAGTQILVYSVTRDTFNNFIANVPADAWALQSVTGGILSGDLVPALDRKSAVFTGHMVGTAVIGATSGALPTTTSGTLTVTPGPLDNFLVESSVGGNIPTEAAGVPFTIRVTARDTFGNTESAFGGTVGITSTGTLSAGGGTTTSFTSGVLNSYSVTFSNTGAFTITATRTAGTETGASNLFTVTTGPARNVRVETLPSGGGILVPPQNVVPGNQVLVYAVTRDTFNNFIANVAADSWVLQSVTGGVLSGDLVPSLDRKSAVFTGHKVGTAVIGAASGVLSTTTSGTLTVTPGPLDNFLVESSVGGNIPTQAAGVPFTIRVTARDTFGNTASGFVGTVGITSTGTLSAGGGTTAVFTNGVLSSQSVEFSNTGTFTITATRTAGTETGTSNLFTVTTGPAKSVKVETLPTGSGSLVPPQNVVAGNQIQVYAVTRDTFNNFIANVAADSWALQSVTGGVLPGDLVPSLDRKSAVFTGHKTGTTVIHATSGAVPATTSGTLTVTPGPLDNFLVESSAGGNIPTEAAGVPFTIRVTARDTFGNTASGFAGTVSITSTGTLSAGGGTTSSFTSGVLNSYSVTFSNTGTFTITATRTAGTETGTSNLFTVTQGAATKVRVETLPNGAGVVVPIQNVIAGNQIQVYAVTRDTFNNFIANVAADSWVLQSVTGGVLSGDLVPSLDRKSAVFTGHKTGTAVIHATSGAVPATSSGTLTVTPGPLDNFLVESSAGGNIPTEAAGVPFTIRVTARDTFGNTASGFAGTVSITSTGTLSAGGGTTAAFASGVLSSQSVTFSNTGTFTITATRTAGTETGTSNLFTVTQGAATKVRVETLPNGAGVVVPIQNVIAGNQIQVYAVTRDTFNNFIANVAADSWALQSVTGGVLSGDLVPSLDRKSAVFTGHKTGTAVIHATSGVVPATSSGTLTVTPGPLHNFLVESSVGGNIPTEAAGVPFTIKVTARDTFGNTASSFAGTVGITSTGTLSAGGGTTAAFASGVLSSQSVTFSNTGSFTITATRTAGTETGTSNLFTVTQGAATKVRVETLPNGTGVVVPLQNDVAGNQVLVYAVTRDTFNNFIANVAADSWALQSVTGGVLPGDLVPSLDRKSAVFTGHKTGTAVIHATSGVVPATSSGTITVTPGPLDNFLVESSVGGNIPGQTLGIPFSIKITARDTFGNTVPGFAGTVGITSTGTLSAGGGTTASFASGVLNSHSVTISNTGTFSITATRTGGTETGTSNLFAVNPGSATKVRVETLPNGTGVIVPPQSVVAGIQVLVYAVTRDTFNNFIANVAADSWALQSVTGGVVAGDLVPSPDRKSAVFTGHKVGTAMIGAASGVLPATTSGTLTVAPGPLNNFLVESSAGGNIHAQIINSPFTIRVTAHDTFGNTVPGFQGTVDITCTGTLSAGGGTTPAFTNGVLSSYSVTVSNAGSFKLTATQTGGVISGTSNPFFVNNPLPSITNITPSAAARGQAGFPMTVNGTNFTAASVVDFAGTGLVTTFNNTTQLSAAITTSDLATTGTFAITVSNPEPGGGTSNTQTFTVAIPAVNVRVFLQGPFANGSMRTTLRDRGLIPLNQPYNAAPYNYAGTERVGVIPAQVVDWLLVELRSGTSAPSTVARRAAFVKANGAVVDTDGVSPLAFPTLGAGNFYVVIRHRNHIAVMSAITVGLSIAPVQYDFTTATSQGYGSEAMNVGVGQFAMYAGDYSENGFIDIDDFVGPDNEIFHSGYLRADHNMDGFIDSGDFVDPDNNLFKGTRVPN